MKKFLALLSFLLFTLLICYGCQPQAERTYTDAEVQKIFDNATKLWNSGAIEIVNTIYAENSVYHNADFLEAEGPAEIKEFVKWVYTAYPDFAVTLDEPMQFKDRIVITYKATGTNNGPSGENMPATGKQMSFNGVSISKIENGKITEEWNYYNQLPINKKLGYKLVLVEEEPVMKKK
jgi:steroid delta-isomerase-like uncharacterized protein